ncbi:hypothetical protein GCK72_000502 [Caenorhabditis remanei]|uniref:F-box associated domain-containing protein n=1 Tax=Caenorhabditis remanei TaxID=31234 RepID=A0A6A5HM78_CAERE|nr:hypothetical protein GCK72_000502 [Caenorhabditis remanei]KAF1768689.1 hypothetical protein GCK72_000502 [Caenorhabditis remanei]
MTKKLSYPDLRCVLEYLEANRRIHITARSPALRRIEKSIPIHLEFLKIKEYNIELNDIEMTLCSDNKIEFKKGEKRYDWDYPVDLEHKQAVEKMNEYYLGGRMNIYADDLWFLNRQMDSFTKFNVKTNELTVFDFILNDILQYINPNSFPLKKLTIECYDDFNHPHIRSANSLRILLMYDREKHENAAKIVSIQNKNVELSYKNLEFMDVMVFIQYWMENGKEVGTTFSCSGYGYVAVDGILNQLKNEFNEIMSELDGVSDKNLIETSGFSIPLNSSSKILVYGRRNSEDISNEEIVLKVVSSQADDSTMDLKNQ